MANKSKTEMQPWDVLIRLAETKIARSKRKTDQLQALLAVFHEQAKAGDPIDVERLSLGLSKLLQ